MKFPPIDPRRAVTYPLEQRKSKVNTEGLGKVWKAGGTFGSFLRSLPAILAGSEIREVATLIAKAYRTGCPIVLGMGAHPLKVGLSPIIVDLLERGVISAIALNGAGIVHDFELAFQGATSEDVGASLGDGSFGMATETGEFLNEAIERGVLQGDVGIGRSVGEYIIKKGLPYAQLSVLATCARLQVPATVHVAIGTDIVHMHPTADGGAIGTGSLRDFHLLTSVVARLEGGVFMNLGSAVIIPEVFLKALSLARNLGHDITSLTTVDMDFIRHYRPTVNVVQRPTLGGGRGFQITGHHEIMFPLICAAALEQIENESDG